MKTHGHTFKHRASLEGSRGFFSLRAICCGLVLFVADLAMAGGMYPYNHKFTPPVHVVRIKLQRTQNGIQYPVRTYRLVSVPPQNGVMRISGTYSEVDYIGSFGSVADVCRAVPADVSVYESSQSWFIRAEWYKELQAPKPSQPRFTAPVSSAPARTFSAAQLNPKFTSSPVAARSAAPARDPLPSAGLDPEPVVVERATGGGIYQAQQQQQPGGGGGRQRPPRWQAPPLRSILFGAIAPAGPAVSGRYYSLHPDGSVGGILGSFRVEGDEMKMTPAGGNEEIHVLLNDAPTATTLDAQYVNYAGVFKGGFGESMNRYMRSTGSGDLSFDLDGDTLTASITQKHVTLTDNSPSGVNTMRVTSPITQRIIFIPD